MSTPRITRRLCEAGIIPGQPLHGDCPRVSTTDAILDGIPISLCASCALEHAATLDAPRGRWVPLDLARPAVHLRELAGLSLAAAAAALSVASPSVVHKAERAESATPGAGLSVSGLLRRAAAYHLELRIQVRALRP